MANLNKIILSWFLVFLWMGVIYYFSDQPHLKSDLAPLWDTILRKIAHAAEFFILAYLLFNAYRQMNISFYRALYMSLVLAILYAFFDEYHQSLVAGRHHSYLDVSIDSLGASSFAILRYKYRSYYKE